MCRSSKSANQQEGRRRGANYEEPSFISEPNFSNKDNKELWECGAKQSSVAVEAREQAQRSGVEAHTTVLLLMSESIKTWMTTAAVVTDKGSQTAEGQRGRSAALRPL